VRIPKVARTFNEARPEERDETARRRKSGRNPRTFNEARPEERDETIYQTVRCSNNGAFNEARPEERDETARLRIPKQLRIPSTKPAPKSGMRPRAAAPAARRSRSFNEARPEERDETPAMTPSSEFW